MDTLSNSSLVAAFNSISHFLCSTRPYGFFFCAISLDPSLTVSLTQSSVGSGQSGPDVIQPIHSVGYHFSQISLALILDEVEELDYELDDELDDELEEIALDVVTELMEELRGSSRSSRGSSVALLPLKENASVLTSFKTSASVFPEGTPFLISLINMTGVKY